MFVFDNDVVCLVFIVNSRGFEDMDGVVKVFCFLRILLCVVDL